MTSAIFSYCLYALLGVYAVGFVRLFVQKVNLSSTRWLIGAFVCWPLFMLDEWLRLAHATDLAVIYGLSDVFCCFSHYLLLPCDKANVTGLRNGKKTSVVACCGHCTFSMHRIADPRRG